MSVSIIGCGWLGQALAKSLMAEGVFVLASYQSQSTLDKLNALKIPATPLILPCDVDEQDEIVGVDKALFAQDVLVIAIPPQLKKGKVDYLLKIQQLIRLAELGKTKKIILLNSTAIYNGLVGKVDENKALNLDAEKVATLFAAEQATLAFSKQVHILRLAGLVGPSRHPGNFLRSDRIFTNASAQVNLVHQTDVVNIIKMLIKNVTESPATVYNVVSGTKASRKRYYQVAAKALGLSPPRFEAEQARHESKQVVGDKLRQELHYHYHYDDLLQWLTVL